MGKYDGERLVTCPECWCLLVSTDLARHYKKTHQRDLSGAEVVTFLEKAKKYPIDAKKAKAFWERIQGRRKKNDFQMERTPRSMQQWEGGSPRIGMRSGPIGGSMM